MKKIISIKVGTKIYVNMNVNVNGVDSPADQMNTVNYTKEVGNDIK